MKIAILVHIGNFNLWKELKYYVDNVVRSVDSVDLYISYQVYNETLRDIIRKYKDCYIVQCTKGCDVGGQLLLMKYIMDIGKNYDYILKLHTKTDKEWRRELIDSIAGTEKIIREVIDKFEEDENIGMISSGRWILKNDKYNIPIVEKISKKLNLTITPTASFVGGTIFWMRWELFLKFFSLHNVNLMLEYFECEEGYLINSVPTYTHSWERIFGLFIYSFNCYIYGFPSPSHNDLLPSSFEYSSYLSLNPDVAKVNSSKEFSISHYLNHGRFEYRRC